jgi:hypothetical protein
MALQGEKEMTQYIYIVKEKPRSIGWNPVAEYKGDYPPLRYIARNGVEMVKVMTEAWSENKQAKDFTFVDGDDSVTINRNDIPTVLSTSVNEANICADTISWLKIATQKLQ